MTTTCTPPTVATMNLRERTDSTPEQRLFDAWLSGRGRNVLPGLYEPHIYTSKQAIAWCCEVEREAYKHGIPTERVYHNF